MIIPNHDVVGIVMAIAVLSARMRILKPRVRGLEAKNSEQITTNGKINLRERNINLYVDSKGLFIICLGK